MITIGFIIIAILVIASYEESTDRSKKTHNMLNRIIRDLEELKSQMQNNHRV